VNRFRCIVSGVSCFTHLNETHTRNRQGCAFARDTRKTRTSTSRAREFFIDNLLVRIHFIIEMIWRTGLAPWEFEFPFPAGMRFCARHKEDEDVNLSRRPLLRAEGPPCARDMGRP